MNELNDKLLHDLVRQRLHGYRPDYDPRDWKAMHRLLRRRRWWQWGAVAGFGLLLFGVIGWSLLSKLNSAHVPLAVRRSVPVTTPAPISEVKLPEPISVRNKPLPVVKRIHQQGIAVEQNRFRSEDLVRLKPRPISVTTTTNLTGAIQQLGTVTYNSEEPTIQRQMLTGEFGPDSTSYHALTRNANRWPDAVVVCDLTTSMYPYTTQLFTWLRQHSRNSSVKGFVFFTDCDSLGQQTQPGGPAGRMFVTRERKATAVLPMMLEAARNTVHNHDDAENTVEALLYAQKVFPDAKHLILLADNLSLVKDMIRLSGVQKPVHVILCGTTGGTLSQPFQTDYYTIASRTKGSLHTIDDDLDPDRMDKHTVLHIGNYYYRYQKRRGQFKLTSFDHRPVCLLGFVWL